MSSQVKDPFGGVLGESKSTSPSPFKVDKEQALKDIQKSINIWDNKKIVRKSFLQKLLNANLISLCNCMILPLTW